MLLLRKLVITMVSSNQSQKIFLTNSVAPVVQKMLQWEFIKNSWKLNGPSLLKGQECGNEILESSISLENFWKMISITLVTKVWHIDFIEYIAK